MIKKRKSKGALRQMIASTSKVDIEKMSNRLLLASKIGNALKNAGISQKRFSEMMNRTESEISDWLSGNRNFTIDTLTEISTSLGISLLNTHSASCYTVSMDYSICNGNKKNVEVTEHRKWNLSMGNIVSDKKHQLVV